MFFKIIGSIGATAWCVMFGFMPIEMDRALGQSLSIMSLSCLVMVICVWLAVLRLIWKGL